MIVPKKFEIMFYNSEAGLEFVISMRGEDIYRKAKKFLDLDTSGSKPVKQTTDYYVVSAEQLKEFNGYLRQVEQGAV